MKAGLLGLCLLLSLPAMAANDIHQLFLQALATGESTAALPNPDPKLVQFLQAQTKSDGPILIRALRVAQFKQQSRCGRIAYALYQASSNTMWPETGGQLNLCDDGLPPWQQCGDNPELVAPGTACPFGVKPHNTTEVQQAIDTAVANGSILWMPRSVQQRMDASSAKGRL